MTEEKFRNHPTVMIQNLAIAMFMMLISLMNVLMMDAFFGAIIMAAIVAAAIIISVIFWARRTISFGAEEAVVESNILYKKVKTIPYSKIGSVNLNRGVFNQIFGTTTLSIHVNTSTNPKLPEARFTFNEELAERIKKDLSKGVFDQHEATHDDTQYESVIKFSFKDVVLHSVFGMPTYSFLLGFVMLVYSFLSALFLDGSGMFYSLFIFAIFQPIPMILSILKYLNFKIYRIGDQIHVQYGSIQKFVSKFDINRVNAVRIRKPLLARIMGRSCLEAEVVGINSASGEVVPLLCLMSKNNEIERTIKELVPEFIYDVNLIKQPASSKRPLLFKATVGSILSILILALPAYDLYTDPYGLGEQSDLETMIVKYFLIGMILLCVALFFYAAHVSYKIKMISKGDSLFTVVNGLVDRTITTMQYDRIQIFKVSSSPLARRLGLARCYVNLLSAAGAKKISTGYFNKEELEEIGDIMMDRLKNGAYDYKKNNI
jgi:Predicted membrane protein